MHWQAIRAHVLVLLATCLVTLSIKTVQTHRAHIMEKLDAHDRTDLVKYAIRQGMIPPE